MITRTAIIAAVVAVLLSAGNVGSMGPCADPPPSFNPAGMPKGNAYDHGGRNPYDPGTWAKPDPSQPFGGMPAPYPY